jgi:hypothetical protein
MKEIRKMKAVSTSYTNRKDSSTNDILAYNLSNSLAMDIVNDTINN